jgi:hypothetical protein
VSSAELFDAELGAARADGDAGTRIEHTASFDAGLRHLASPATEQEHRLRSLLSGGLVSAADQTLARGAEVIAARRSDNFTRFDGNLAGLTIPSPVDQVTSATRLELWAGCPFAYLQQFLLGIAEVENPEDELRISPLDKGSLVHEILERFILEVLARPTDQQRASDQPWTKDDLAELVGIAHEVCDRFEGEGLTGRPIFWRRDRAQIVADLSRFLDNDSTHRQATGTRPIAAELAFGFGRPPVGGVPLRLPDGRVVTFRGKADRVDVAAGNQVYVVDYKTGKTTAFEKLSEANPDLQGRKLQLAVYGEAARLAHGTPDSRVRAEYWFVSKKGGFERIGYELTADIRDRVGTTIGVMVSGIESGVFPNYTTEMSTSPMITCAYCDPDRLGVVEVRRRWQRKRADPALRIFADLAEPPSEDDDEGDSDIEGNVTAEAATHA